MNQELTQMSLPDKMLCLVLDIIEGFPDRLDHEIPNTILYRNGLDPFDSAAKIRWQKDQIMMEVRQLFGSAYPDYTNNIEQHLNKRVDLALDRKEV